MTGSPNTPKFRSPDPTHRPAIEALELTGRYAAAGNRSYYPPGEHVPAHPGLRGTGTRWSSGLVDVAARPQYRRGGLP